MVDWFKKKKHEPNVRVPTPLSIEVGDVVAYDERYWMVEQKLSYRQGGYTWFDYRLVDKDETIWLAAEDDDGLSLAIYRELTDVQVPDQPPKRWTIEQHVFTLDEAGECEVVVESNISAPRTVRVKYWDYEAEDGALLSVEDWQGDREVSLGKAIEAWELNILPGNGEQA